MRQTAVFFTSMFLSASSLCAQPLSRDGWETAFDRRGYRVGISLSEAKEIRPPDPLPEGQHARFACSDESGFRISGPQLSPTAVRAGLRVCAMMLTDRSGNLTDIDWSPLLLDMGTTTRFHFAQLEGEPEPLLLRIQTRDLKSADISRIRSAYITQLGQPVLVTHPVFQTRSGARFDNTITRWENRVSYLELRHYDDSLDWGSSDIVHIPILTRFLAQFDRARTMESRGRL